MAAIRDINRIPQLRKDFGKTNKRRVEVGIFDDAPSLVKIGVLNEFGTRVRVDATLARGLRALAEKNNYPTDNLPKEGEELIIPERSFMRSTFDEEADDIARDGHEYVHEWASGTWWSADHMLRTLGRRMQLSVVETVASGSGLAPNDPLTIAVKGHDRPLIGKTGVLETTKGIRVRVGWK